MHNVARSCLACLVAVFVVIAVPTYLCGCDPVLQPYCLRYHLVPDAVVTSYAVTHDRCSSSCYSGSCTRLYYDCYDSFAVMTYTRDSLKNVTCNLDVDSDNMVRANALEDAIDEYPLGTEHTILVDKTSGHCFTQHQARTLAIVGVVFFALAGATVFLCLVLEFRIPRVWNANRYAGNTFSSTASVPSSVSLS